MAQIPRTEQGFLIISAHDYRTPRRANMHFIADELAKRGQTCFFSLRYSFASRFLSDPRNKILSGANRVETLNGVECYLWRVALHPINTRIDRLYQIECLLFRIYIASAPNILKYWIKRSRTIFFESGTAPIFFDLVSKINPTAQTIYIASDDLTTINSATFVKETLARIGPRLTGIAVPSRKLVSEFSPKCKVYFVPHGLDPSLADDVGRSPYGSGIHAVSVGSMLFDEAFFEVAPTLFPKVTFHVIGCGRLRRSRWPSNVIVYEEMKYRDTLCYIKHATLGLAAYCGTKIPEYLSDTSMKLLQYSFFGVPAVCPNSVVGDHSFRFGYQPGDRKSIAFAIEQALSSGKCPPTRGLAWDEVTDRLLEPYRYPDTCIDTQITP